MDGDSPPLRATSAPAQRIIRIDTRLFADLAFKQLPEPEQLRVILSFASASPERRFTRFLGVPVSTSNRQGR